MPSSTSARRTGRASSDRPLPVSGLAGSITTPAIVPMFWSVGEMSFRWARKTYGRRHTTLACFNFAISSALKPNSASTSSVCSPNSGGRAAILLGVRDSVTGWPTRRI